MKEQISAKVIADSVSPDGIRLTTLELEYNRFIHSEFMSHRCMSRNAASSRAIPLKKVVDQVWKDPALPVEWGKNKAGMQADELIDDSQAAIDLWSRAARTMTAYALELHELGVHKQITNRLLEPFQLIKVVVTATEWENFFELRDHKDAQPEIQVLARKIKKAMEQSTPRAIEYGEWHLPYVDGAFLGTPEEKKISASCCAQVSYRVLDDSLEKAEMIYDKLVTSKPLHASPLEHQATPCDGACEGNFQGWRQHRHEIED